MARKILNRVVLERHLIYYFFRLLRLCLEPTFDDCVSRGARTDGRCTYPNGVDYRTNKFTSCKTANRSGSVYILPLYLAQIQGYTAMQIGEVIMWSGLPQLFLIPFVPRLMKFFDLRFMAAVGFSLFAVSCFMNSQMTQYTGINELRWSQLVRALGQPLMILPLRQ